MADHTPIPPATLAAVRRRLCRQIGAEVVRAMAETDSSFASIAERLELPERRVRKWVHRLIAGGEITLHRLSDLAYGMDCAMHVTLAQEPAE